MSKFCDLTGKEFGYWTVLGRADDYVDKKGNRFARWNCRCACGNVSAVIGGNLTRGKSKSCGCYKSDCLRKINKRIKTDAKYKSLSNPPTTDEMMHVMLGEVYDIIPKEERLEVALRSVFYNCWFKFVRDEQTTIRRHKGEHPTCELCGKTCETAVHHIRPVSEYGGNEPENLMWLCENCHKEIERKRASK